MKYIKSFKEFDDELKEKWYHNLAMGVASTLGSITGSNNVSADVATNTTKTELTTSASALTQLASGKYKGIDVGSNVIYISIKSQTLSLIQNGKIIQKYPISSAKAGVGSEPNSNKTPTGLHVVKEKIGDGSPVGEIIKGGAPTGEISRIYTDKTDVPTDHVTTRVMWLDGVEEDNTNTHERHVYIHGTPEEGLLGVPNSHGCIRMKNTDVISLFDRTPSGTHVLIDDN